jgi:NDP-sugar pyrophosphorylase family protein
MDEAVILAGGKGVRLASGTEDMPKPMILIGGKPILHYVVSLLCSLGFQKIYVVVGYRKDAVMNYFGTGSGYGVRIEYVENTQINQAKKSGLSDAVLLMKDVIRTPFMMMLGDEIYAGTKHPQMLALFEKRPDLDAMIAVHATPDIEDVKKNYSVKINAESILLDLEEKPDRPWNNLIGCGTYIFRESIFDYIEKTPVSTKSGRRELADSMKLMVTGNKRLYAYDIGGRYLNINYPQDIAVAERLMARGE